MAWGRKDFSSYVSVRQCDQAIRKTTFDLSRRYNRDTAFQLVVPNNPDPKTPPEVIAMANACGQRFTLETVDPQELWSFMRVAFARQNDTQAMAAFERRYALAGSELERITVLTKGARELFYRTPPRIASVLDLLRRLDAFGDTARMDRIAVRTLLLDYWYERYNVDSIKTYAWSILNLSRDLSQSQRDLVDLVDVWQKLLVIENASADIPAQRALLDSALSNLTEWRRGQGAQWVAAANAWVDAREALYGKKAKPLEPDAWRNDGGVPRPVLGKLSIILRADHNCGAQCNDIHNISRQLIAQYGDNIDVTYTVASSGFAPGSGALAFDDEATAIEHYFVQYLKLPIALAVFETQMYKIADGRIVREGSALDDTTPRFDAIIIDKSGNVRWLGRLRSHQDKRMIDAAIINILRGT